MQPDPQAISAGERAAERVVRRLREAGHVALYAGGCVRDRLLAKPSTDIDIATDARPEQIIPLFRRSRTVGAHFGVVIVTQDDCDFEVATFRSDGVYLDGRHPSSVRFSSPEEDAFRRDFTINGMFYDPIGRTVIDHVGGREDLGARLVRAIGDPRARFAEDHLRLLRCVRIAATLDFQIDPATWEATRALAPQILGVSAERIRDELRRMLLAPSRARAFDLLDSSGLLAAILPEIEAMKGCEQPPQFHPEGDVFTHTRLMIGAIREEPPLALVLAVLFHDVGKPPTGQYDDDRGRMRFLNHDIVGARMTEEILRRLRFSNAEIRPTVEAVLYHMRFKDVRQMRVARLKRFMARPQFDLELELHRLDCIASHGDLSNHEFLLRRRSEFQAEPIVPPRILTGNDLIALGWPPGPALGRALEAIQNAQLEGEIRDRASAIDWIEQHRADQDFPRA